MVCFLLSAFAAEPAPPPGTLHIDAKIPSEILVDGAKLAELWFPGRVSFEISTGPHLLRIYTNGAPADHELRIHSGETSRVVVGRTGITLDPLATPESAPDQVVQVELRILGIDAQIRIDEQRLVLASGERTTLSLAPGDHPLSVRSRDGTIVWARGTLEVGVGQHLIVQIAEGRLPALSGSGRFHASGG